MRRLFIIYQLLFCFNISFAQNKYWIYFKDKDQEINKDFVSSETYANRKLLKLELRQYSDIPVNRSYLKKLMDEKLIPVNESRWLNAVSMYLAKSELHKVRSYPFVKDIELINFDIFPTDIGSDIVKMTYSLEQIKARAFKDAGLTGKGVKIGVIDGRFAGANKSIKLNHLFKNQKVAGIKNFVLPGDTPYSETHNGFDQHGTYVLTFISGFDPNENLQYGTALDASFYLATTDDSNKEFRGEEDYWIAALEWMDSVGVRLVNTSLGYSFGFDNPQEDYLVHEMDGKISAIAKAAQISAKEKGMIIVTSAGNEGRNSWKILSTPADAKDVISVGATDQYALKKEVSSVGPSFLPYIKPDVACYSDGGTSFSAPIITGIVACMLQKKPAMRIDEVKEILKKSGHIYPFGNNYLGYGIPNVERILKLIENKRYDLKRSKEIRAVGKQVILDEQINPSSSPTVFHKKDERTVVYNQQLVPIRDKFIIHRLDGISRSTVTFNDGVIEIYWE